MIARHGLMTQLAPDDLEDSVLELQHMRKLAETLTAKADALEREISDNMLPMEPLRMARSGRTVTMMDNFVDNNVTRAIARVSRYRIVVE